MHLNIILPALHRLLTALSAKVTCEGRLHAHTHSVAELRLALALGALRLVSYARRVTLGELRSVNCARRVTLVMLAACVSPVGPFSSVVRGALALHVALPAPRRVDEDGVVVQPREEVQLVHVGRVVVPPGYVRTYA